MFWLFIGCLQNSGPRSNLWCFTSKRRSPVGSEEGGGVAGSCLHRPYLAGGRAPVASKGAVKLPRSPSLSPRPVLGLSPREEGAASCSLSFSLPPSPAVPAQKINPGGECKFPKMLCFKASSSNTSFYQGSFFIWSANLKPLCSHPRMLSYGCGALPDHVKNVTCGSTQHLAPYTYTILNDKTTWRCIRQFLCISQILQNCLHIMIKILNTCWSENFVSHSVSLHPKIDNERCLLADVKKKKKKAL